ncbi:FAD/NAD(P)-binding domain-containing protein [Mycena chlorophos]|uniref:FAD/NAD(P)-binding domain-containing protein n=1 Tax=Mycena chlorophos TaxID=658473 RepID=A0A8H6SJ36_MYCCL|nr:FAD/NAD(P)-binding domain-containing protein [Mycena chlorophos]
MGSYRTTPTPPPMSLPPATEVLIVGAGPTGLTCALGLSKRGIPFVIIDAVAAGHNESRAVVVHSCTLETLGAIDESLAHTISADGIRSPTLTALDAKQRVLFRVQFDKLADRTKYPYCVLCPQHRVEKHLRQGLGRHEVYWGRRVVSLQEVHGRYEVVFDSGEVVAARYVVGADGNNSTIRTLAGIRLDHPFTKVPLDPISPKDALSFVVADVLFENPLPEALPKDALTLVLSDAGVIIPLPVPAEEGDEAGNPRRRIYFAVADIPPSKPDLHYLQGLLETRQANAPPAGGQPIPRITRVLDSGRFRTGLALAETYICSATSGTAHILLAGDAAHRHGPGGGQGMNLGICDAAALAEAIAEHHSAMACLTDSRKAAAREEIFSRYEQRRMAVAREVIFVAEEMAKVEKPAPGWAGWVRTNLLWLLLKIPAVNQMAAWRLSGMKYV